MKRFILITQRFILFFVLVFFFLYNYSDFIYGDDVFDIVEIRNISDHQKTNLISWYSNLTAPTNGWVVANQYIYLHYNKNHTICTGWGIEIYTDNTTNQANPVFIGVGTNIQGGLVSTGSSNIILPMAWKIFSSYPSIVTNPVERDDHNGFSDYSWHFMLDKGSRDFFHEKDYIVPYNQGGIAWHEAVRQNKSTNAYIFLAAKFDNAYADTYRTSMLKLVQFDNPFESLFWQNMFYIYINEWADENPMPNHYIPQYWPNDWSTSGNPDFGWTTDYYSAPHCIKTTIQYGSGWGRGIYWNEPETATASGPGIGYDLTGAKRISFWIKGDANYNDMQVFANIGNADDSTGGVVNNIDNSGSDRFNISTNWEQHFIPLLGYDLSHIRVGFNIGAGWKSTGTEVTLYIDDIRYEQYTATNEGYLWTKQIGGNSREYCHDVLIDSSGNIYLTGDFYSSSINFAQDWGSSDIKENSYDSYCDSFITKINVDGTYGWTKHIGGNYDDRSLGMAKDNSDNIYITGCFGDTVNFSEDWGGSDLKSTHYLDSMDIFITKINSDGGYAWTRTIGSNSFDCGNDVAVDNSGNIYITGYFSSNVNFAYNWSGTDNIFSAGGKDIFITKLNNNGSYAWTKRIGGIQDDAGVALTVDNNGHAYLTGYFSTNVNFAEDWGGSDIKVCEGWSGCSDVFITMISNNGNYGWTRKLGAYNSYNRSFEQSYNITNYGTNSITIIGFIYIYIGLEYALDIQVDGNDNVFVTGHIQDGCDFAEDWGLSDNKSQIGLWDAFVTKINADSSYGWTKILGGEWMDSTRSLFIDSSDNIFLTGCFEGSVNFAADWTGTDIKGSQGGTDVFITKINSDGSYGGTRRMGGPGRDEGTCVLVDSNGMIYTFGLFSSSVNFGTDWSATEFKSCFGYYDIFITKISNL